MAERFPVNELGRIKFPFDFGNSKIDPSLFTDTRNRASGVLDVYNNPNTLKQMLQNIAEAYPNDISYRELESDNYPQIQTENRSSCKLENAELIDSEKKRALVYGDEHGLIFPFLQRVAEKTEISFPVSTVVNIDYHADIDKYTDQHRCHTATWQRYGVDNGLWNQSLNWQPDNGNAWIKQDINADRYIRTIKANEVDELNPDILSIDLDFFNNLLPEGKEFNIYIEKIKGLIRRSKCIFVFSSSGWTKFETLSPETMERIIKEIQDTFTEE